jgi:hypothetical protein
MVGDSHAIIAAPEMADQAAMDGVGRGYIEAAFEQFLFKCFDTGGAVVILIAWLIIGIT